MTNDMQVHQFSTNKIEPNPWQVRVEDDQQHIQVLADDIKVRGLLQVPIGRFIDGGRRVQLAFGHSRLAAWKIAKPGEDFPIMLRELADIEMSNLATAENARRKNLTAIEIAKAIARRMQVFGLSQMEAAQPFGYTNQGAVSNLLRLLRLPDEVQQLIQKGNIAGRNARALLIIERLGPTHMVKIAKESVSKKNPEQYINDTINELLKKRNLIRKTNKRHKDRCIRCSIIFDDESPRAYKSDICIHCQKEIMLNTETKNLQDTIDQLRANIKALLKQIGEPALCSGCGKEIWFVRHLNGKRAPYTAEGLNHFADCPQAKKFKKVK